MSLRTSPLPVTGVGSRRNELLIKKTFERISESPWELLLLSTVKFHQLIESRDICRSEAINERVFLYFFSTSWSSIDQQKKGKYFYIASSKTSITVELRRTFNELLIHLNIWLFRVWENQKKLNKKTQKKRIFVIESIFSCFIECTRFTFVQYRKRYSLDVFDFILLTFEKHFTGRRFMKRKD